MEHKDIFLTTKEVSKYLGIPLRTVYRLAEQGKIKSIRIGGKLRFFKDDIEKHYYLGTDFSYEPARRNTEFIERRTFPRINTNLISRYSVNLPPFKDFNTEGLIKNISANGVLLITKGEGLDEIEIDDPIELDFNLISKDKILNIKVTARVVRKVRNGLGIRFRSIKEEDRKAIIEFVG